MEPNRMMSPRALRRLALCVVAVLPVLAACSSSKDEEAAKDSNAPPSPVEDLYNNGIDALNARRFAAATDQFNLVEQNYPYSSWAVNAQLMQGYAEYLRNHYTDAIATLDRDIQRDQRGTDLAMSALQEVVNRFPDSAYARDARLKLDLCRDHLAGKEMEIG